MDINSRVLKTKNVIKMDRTVSFLQQGDNKAVKGDFIQHSIHINLH